MVGQGFKLVIDETQKACVYAYILIPVYTEARGFPGGSAVKNLPAMQETQV